MIAERPASDHVKIKPTRNPILVENKKQLGEYFEGKRQRFDLKIQTQGTAFQSKVWMKLEKIPYGKTWSYGELADKTGKPGASRAVGTAVGSNKLPIVIPCHRVIQATGKVGGFAWGTPAKKLLLELENRNLLTHA